MVSAHNIQIMRALPLFMVKLQTELSFNIDRGYDLPKEAIILQYKKCHFPNDLRSVHQLMTDADVFMLMVDTLNI